MAGALFGLSFAVFIGALAGSSFVNVAIEKPVFLLLCLMAVDLAVAGLVASQVGWSVIQRLWRHLPPQTRDETADEQILVEPSGGSSHRVEFVTNASELRTVRLKGSDSIGKPSGVRFLEPQRKSVQQGDWNVPIVGCRDTMKMRDVIPGGFLLEECRSIGERVIAEIVYYTPGVTPLIEPADITFALSLDSPVVTSHSEASGGGVGEVTSGRAVAGGSVSTAYGLVQAVDPLEDRLHEGRMVLASLRAAEGVEFPGGLFHDFRMWAESVTRGGYLSEMEQHYFGASTQRNSPRKVTKAIVSDAQKRVSVLEEIMESRRSGHD